MRKMLQSALLATVAIISSNTGVWAVGSQSAQKVESSAIQQLAQQQPLCLNMAFTNGPVVHRGRLIMGRNGRGTMRVVLSDPRGGGYAIDQAMVMRSTQRGVLLVGANPVFAGTNRRAPNYVADNFLIESQRDGDYVVVMFDDRGNTSPVEVSACR
jgi:hypothetical protein